MKDKLIRLKKYLTNKSGRLKEPELLLRKIMVATDSSPSITSPGPNSTNFSLPVTIGSSLNPYNTQPLIVYGPAVFNSSVYVQDLITDGPITNFVVTQTEMNAIQGPEIGMQVFNSTANMLYCYGSGGWAASGGGGGGGTGTVTRVTAGTGLNVTGVTSGGDITTTGTINLTNTAVTSGSYAYPSSVVVNAQGQVTGATVGAQPVTSVTSGDSTAITVGGTFPAVTINLTGVTAKSGTYPSLVTSDSFGRVTAITSGTQPITSITTSTLSVSTTTPASVATPSIDLAPNASWIKTNISNPTISVDTYGRVTSATSGTLSANSVLIGGAANAINSTAALTNGQLVIGSTNNAPTAARITDGTNITWTLGAGTLKADLTSIIGVTLGGTGASSFTNLNSVLLSGSTTTGALNAIASGTAGKVLTSGGPGVLPTWQTPSGGAGTVTQISAGGSGIYTSTTPTPNTAITTTGTLYLSTGLQSLDSVATSSPASGFVYKTSSNVFAAATITSPNHTLAIAGTTTTTVDLAQKLSLGTTGTFPIGMPTTGVYIGNQLSYKYAAVTITPYNVSDTDLFLGAAAGSNVFVLATSPTIGRVVTISDTIGVASASPIQIMSNGVTIGAINSNYGSQTYAYNDGVGWALISEASSNFSIRYIVPTLQDQNIYLNPEDSLVDIDTSTYRVNLRLQRLGDLETPKILTIFDSAGKASTNNISVIPYLGSPEDLINGQTGLVMSENYQTISLIPEGTNDWIIGSNTSSSGGGSSDPNVVITTVNPTGGGQTYTAVSTDRFIGVYTDTYPTSVALPPINFSAGDPAKHVVTIFDAIGNAYQKNITITASDATINGGSLDPVKLTANWQAMTFIPDTSNGNNWIIQSNSGNGALPISSITTNTLSISNGTGGPVNRAIDLNTISGLPTSIPQANATVTVDTYGRVTALTAGQLPNVQTFSTPGLNTGTAGWKNPVGAKFVQVLCIGGGSGGGSGARTSAVNHGGGGGGGPGNIAISPILNATAFQSTENVFVGAGGAGCAAVTVSDTGGGVGSNGTNSWFSTGVFFFAGAGNIGTGGQVSGTTAAAGGGAKTGYNGGSLINVPGGGAGGISTTAAISASGSATSFSFGGGGGGGFNLTTPNPGAVGGGLTVGTGAGFGTVISGGAAGVAYTSSAPPSDTLSNGSDGTTNSVKGFVSIGTGGGGGGASAATSGGVVHSKGGNGAFPGGGGGGGGAVTNGATGNGGGGNGASGMVVVYSW